MAAAYRPLPLAVLLLWPVAALAGAGAAELNFDLANDSDLALEEVFIWPAGEREPREEVLYGTALGPGEVVEITLPNPAGTCAFDLLFVLEDGQTIEDQADLCRTDVLALQP